MSGCITPAFSNNDNKIIRYALIKEKFPRQIVLLKSTGCKHKKCTFCDYFFDFEDDISKCVDFNREKLAKIQMIPNINALQVIDSASFIELPNQSIFDIIETSKKCQITLLITEMHYMYKDKLNSLKDFFEKFNIESKFILGLETFDYFFREKILKKGIEETNPKKIAEKYQWANFLFGIKGQTFTTFEKDIQLGLNLFERITINIFIPNTTSYERDNFLIEKFYESSLFSDLKNKDRVEILDILNKDVPDKLGFLGYLGDSIC